MAENTSENDLKKQNCDCNKHSLSQRSSVLQLDINVFDRAYTMLCTLKKFQTEKMEDHTEALLQELSGELLGKRLELGLLQNECFLTLNHEWKCMGSGHNHKFYICNVCHATRSE